MKRKRQSHLRHVAVRTDGRPARGDKLRMAGPRGTLRDMEADVASQPPRPRRSFARWRALSLSLVYVAFTAHIIHWKLTGKTLAPLELNEVMYTLELGIVTAGFLFMALLFLGTAIFGRFFCSWACHIMVLQDLCAWWLGKLHIRRKAIRSRLLLLVPPLTAFYMFLWPQIVRAWHDKAFPTFHLATDAQGWASFVTHNFWRNLPGPWIIALTFLVCGFAIVYLLGSRTFCTYVCPYGAIFALADRFAPGCIRVTDACQQCGTCTAVCTSSVRVHEEVKRHGMVVNPACMKDLDCVAACPQGALHYGFGRPSLFKSFTSGGRFGLPYDFTLAEDALMGAVFVTVLLSFRGLYGRIPFLLSLALGAIIGYVAVVAVRLWTRPNVSLAHFRLKQRGQVIHQGWVFLTGVVLLAVLVGHSGFVRYHEYRGFRLAEMVLQMPPLSTANPASLRDSNRTVEDPSRDRKGAGTFPLPYGHGSVLLESPSKGDRDTAQRAVGHLLVADRWGLLRNELVERSLLAILFRLKRFDDAQTYARRLLQRHPLDDEVRYRLADCLAKQGRLQEAERGFQTITAPWEGRVEQVPPLVVSAYQALGELSLQRGQFAEAARHLRHAAVLDPSRATIHAELGGVLAELGKLEEAVSSLREAVRIDPRMGSAQYNLGTVLAHLGRLNDAIPHYREALVTMPGDAEIHNNLGFALLRTGRLDRARKHLERAISLDSNKADAHYNLGVVLQASRRLQQARAQFHLAAKLDPRYAELLIDDPSP